MCPTPPWKGITTHGSVSGTRYQNARRLVSHPPILEADVGTRERTSRMHTQGRTAWDRHALGSSGPRPTLDNIPSLRNRSNSQLPVKVAGDGSSRWKRGPTIERQAENHAQAMEPLPFPREGGTTRGSGDNQNRTTRGQQHDQDIVSEAHALHFLGKAWTRRKTFTIRTSSPSARSSQSGRRRTAWLHVLARRDWEAMPEHNLRQSRTGSRLLTDGDARDRVPNRKSHIKKRSRVPAQANRGGRH